MTIQNEAAYQAGMRRLESLDSTNPQNLAEMEALGHALEAYEDRQGHAPGARIQLAAQGGDHDPRTAHLRPVIEHLLAQGNTPASRQGDAFAFDQGGEGHYLFASPLDAAQLRERFAFPASIRVYDDGYIKDSLNRVDISHERPTPPFTFELAPAHAPLAGSTPPSTTSSAVANGDADELLRQIIAARQK